MRAVNIADLKNNLSRYLDEVRRGEEVLVRDRNKPIARIIPFTDADDEDAQMKELIARGIAKPPKSTDPLPASFWTKPLPKTSADLIDLIREDRDAR
jgi:prevent-host-death family protein